MSALDVCAHCCRDERTDVVLSEVPAGARHSAPVGITAKENTFHDRAAARSELRRAHFMTGIALTMTIDESRDIELALAFVYGDSRTGG